MKRPLCMFTILLALVPCLAACTASDDAMIEVRLGEVTRSIFYAPQYVALTNGYFEDEGLQVELRTTPGGDVTMTNLLSGAIDIALVGSETSVYVYQQGAQDPVINFAQLTQSDGTFLMSRERLEPFSDGRCSRDRRFSDNA